MERDELVRRHPLLFHAAAAGAWPSIRDHGLRTAAELVASGDVAPDVVDAALSRPRTAAVRFVHPGLGAVELRDQTPLRMPILERVLEDVTPAEWLRLLNGHVFFFLHPARLERLLDARRARHRDHDVIVVDTASLLARHGDRARLSPINSGAALWPSAPRRGSTTFTSVEDYPYDERRRSRSAADAVAELAIEGGVPDLRDHVLRVERRHGPVLTEVGQDRGDAHPPVPPEWACGARDAVS